MAKFIITYRTPDGTVLTDELSDSASERIEKILKGENINPGSAIEAYLKLKGGSSGGGGSSSGGGSSGGGNDNQDFFTDEEIEDIWNQVNP